MASAHNLSQLMIFFIFIASIPDYKQRHKVLSSAFTGNVPAKQTTIDYVIKYQKYSI